MGRNAAKLGDKVVGVDIHGVIIPPAPIPTLLPHPFNGIIVAGVSTDVLIEGKPAATIGSKVVNLPPHSPQGGFFPKPPLNDGTVIQGSTTVLINGKPAARSGDSVMTCNDPAPAPGGRIVAVGTVLIG